MGFKVFFVSLFLIPSVLFGQQKLKYTSDIEPLIKSGLNMVNVPKLERYYNQSLGPNGKPTPQNLKVFKTQLHNVSRHAGRTYDNFARLSAKAMAYDTAIYAIGKAALWYQVILSELMLPNDTLPRYIESLKSLKVKWEKERKDVVSRTLVLRDSLGEIMFQIAQLDKKKHDALQYKFKNIQQINEYEKSLGEASNALVDLQNRKALQDQYVKSAVANKQLQSIQNEKIEKQNIFLQLQQQCRQENACPNCPLEVARKFRDAYYSGDIATLKSLIIDYFNNKSLFYNADLNMYAEMTPEQTKKLSLRFKTKTADFKKTDPENVVYYSDNEKRNFYIDKYYKSQLLHATVFKAINDYDKMDLVKWKGKWKVYRVGGNYGGRSGKSIVSGRFLIDPALLKAEE